MVTAVSIRRTAFLRCDPDLATVGYVTVMRFPVEGSVSAHSGPKMRQGEKIVRTGPNFNPFAAESEHRALLIRFRKGFKMIVSHHLRFRCGRPPARGHESRSQVPVALVLCAGSPAQNVCSSCPASTFPDVPTTRAEPLKNLCKPAFNALRNPIRR